MTRSTPATTQGIHHLGLTVPDLERTRRFFCDVLGFSQVGEVPEYPAVFLSDETVMVTLWQAADPAGTAGFDRKNRIGLHHLALVVPDASALDALHAKLTTEADVVIEFGPEPLGGGPTRHMMCAIPSGIRVEFIAPASA